HWMCRHGPAAFSGKLYKLPKTHFARRPVQQPNPPVYFAAFAPASMKRIAEYGDGWLPVAIPPAAMRQIWDDILQTAKDAGRDTRKMEFIVRANIELKDEPLGASRRP